MITFRKQNNCSISSSVALASCQSSITFLFTSNAYIEFVHCGCIIIKILRNLYW